LIKIVRKKSEFFALYGDDKMFGKRMTNFMAGLLFVGILCMNSGAFGSLLYNDAGLSSEEAAGNAQGTSEVVFIDPSVRKAEIIVSQLPEGVEVVRLSPIMDGVAQISEHLEGKVALSAIRIISHGDAGHFFLNGKRIDGDFLWNHGGLISAWGRALAETGDILLYTCNLAATDEGRAFVKRFVDLTGADVAASTDVTGGEAFNGNWNLEYSIGRISTTALTIDPDVSVKLDTRTWTGDIDNDWGNSANWAGGSGPPVDGDEVIIDTSAYNPNMNVSTTFLSFTINLGKTLNVITGGAINTTGDVTINGAISATGTTAISISADSINLNGSINSVVGSVTLNQTGSTGGINLTGASTITSSSGPITFMGKIDGAFTLDVNAGTGLIDFQQAIGSATSPTTLTITQSGGTTFQGDVSTSAGVVLTDTTDGANITFTGVLGTPTLTTASEGYNVELLGGCLIINETSFLNTGTTTIGTVSGDSSVFSDGLIATDGPVSISIAGTVTVVNGDAPMELGETTVSDDSTLNQPLSETNISLSLGAVTINDTKTLTAGNNNGQAISFSSTINSASGGTGNLIINNDAIFMDDVGGTTAIGTLTLTNGVVTANAVDITAGGIAVNAGTTFGQPESPSGAWDVSDITIAAGAIMNATTGAFSVSGDWDNSGTFNHKNGTVTLDGSNQTIIGSTTFYNLIKNVTSAATLTFPSATTTTVDNTLNLSGASGQLLALISSTPGTQWEIDPQGTRTIAYLDVKDSNNVNTTAINTAGTNSVDSGNNTNWTFEAPTVTTQAVSGIGTTAATGNGTITNLGSTDPTAHGVCWNTSGTPTISDNVKDNGAASATGSFTASMTGLSPGTTYHVRAFATNIIGTNYGADLTFTAAHTVAAGTYYVNISSGNDANNGSAAHPWKTLHHAITQINGGSAGTYVLHVALGVYSVATGEAESLMVLSQNNVTIIGERGSVPIIDGTSAQNWSKGLEITGSNTIVKNLYVTGFSDTGEEGIRISGGTANEVVGCTVYGNNFGIRISEATNSTVKGCDIYGNSTHGIDAISSTGTTSIVENVIHGNPQYGIRTESSPTISRNEIYDNLYGILVQSLSGAEASPGIKNNVIYEKTPSAMNYGIFCEAKFNSAVNPQIYHNTIDGGVLSGVHTEKDAASSSAPIIKYNIITNFGQYGIQNSGADPIIEYNDVWNNAAGNYSGIGGISTTNISADPLYNSYSLQTNSPCKYIIPNVEDPVTLDYPGFKRPRPGENHKTMGAYEYVANETSNYTMPGGTGLATDYRIFTVPLNLGTGAKMLSAMENVLGTYDPVHWRAFLYTGTLYREFNSSQFASHTIKPGMGFWIITTYTDTIPFEAKPAPDGVDFVMDLQPGWHLIGLPWIDTSILLSAIKVTDGVYTYAISGLNNNLTQKFMWDFTGDGPFNGYEKRSAVGFRLQNNKGYFFKVLGDKTVRLIIPNTDNQAQNAPAELGPDETDTNDDDELPPPPPGAEPVPDIKANGQDGPITVNAGDSVSISVSLGPGVWNGRNADWWVAAYTPFDSPLNWYTYVYPEGWRTGIQVGVQMPLLELLDPLNVLNMVLPVGDYTFYFAVDGNMDGKPDATWLDSVEVYVE
jgi:parallel beta-helix repeat protein